LGFWALVFGVIQHGKHGAMAAYAARNHALALKEFDAGFDALDGYPCGHFKVTIAGYELARLKGYGSAAKDRLVWLMGRFKQHVNP
jgi:hypothetical protein